LLSRITPGPVSMRRAETGFKRLMEHGRRLDHRLLLARPTLSLQLWDGTPGSDSEDVT
jgi:hypothetical protein